MLPELKIDHNSAIYLIGPTYYYAGCGAVTHKLPENCTPADHAEIEFEVLEVTPYDDYFDKDFIPDESEEFIVKALQAMQQYLVDEESDCG
jgi:hypothetical protein